MNLAGVLIILLGLGVAPPPAAAHLQPTLTEEEQADLNIWRQTLNEPGNDPATRRRAVSHLLNRSWVQAYEVLAEALRAFDDAELIRIVVAEICEMEAPPEALIAPLLGALLDAPADLSPILEQAVTAYPPTIIADIVAMCLDASIEVDGRCRLIEILSRFAYWEAVDGLLPLLDEAQPEAVRTAADQALAAITGQSFGVSRTRWEMWVRQNQQEGREGLLARKLERLQVDLETARRDLTVSRQNENALLTDLVSAYEQWYASLNDPAARDELILRLMQKSRPEMNRLALSLIEQRKANAEPISPELVEVVYPSMDHGDPRVRQVATRVLGLLNAEEAARAIAIRFPTESSEAVVQEMLTFLAMHPVSESVEALVGRLESESTAASAVPPLLASARAGLCDDHALRRIADAVLANERLLTRPDAISLLAWTKDELGLNRVTVILRDPGADPGLRSAAARGLGGSGRRDDDLIELMADPIVFDAAVRALVRRGTADALNVVLSRPVPDEARRLSAVERIFAVLEPALWLEADDALAISGMVPVDRRIQWLSGIFDRPNGEGTEVDGLVRRAICLRLARLHLDQKDPGAAMAALQSAPAAESDVETYSNLLATAQIAMGQVNEVAAEVPVSTWLDGLELLVSMEGPSAELIRAVIDRMRAAFADVLTEADTARLVEIESLFPTGGESGQGDDPVGEDTEG